jgi:membrane-associated phospholipid phosphatase
MDASDSFTPWPLRALGWPAALLAAAAASLALDLPVAQGCLAGGCPGELRKLLTFGETFGHGLGVAVIFVVVFQLDPPRRWALPRLIACAAGCGLAADLLKTIVSRGRPGTLAEQQFDFGQQVWATFQGWLPGWSAGYAGQSFPSAHTATAIGLAAALTWSYPRGRWLFFALAAVAGLQRVECGAHFLSDVLAGAAVGALVAPCFLRYGLLPAWFDRREARRRGAAAHSPSLQTAVGGSAGP